MTSSELSVADAIAKFLSSQGTTTVFAVAGGASLHLMHAIAQRDDMALVPLNHEQSVAMAADSFSRVSGSPGVGIVTSGPGATNLVTGIAGAFYDSIACVFITGQVSTSRSSEGLGVRQYGFQETPISEIVSPITKATFSVTENSDIEVTLAEAFRVAQEGRPGPVVIDVPDDIQRLRLSDLSSSTRPPAVSTAWPEIDWETIISDLQSAKRPILILGAGVNSPEASPLAKAFVRKTGIPVALTWGAVNTFASSDENFIGFFGTHGDRHANILLESSDLIISVGCRLDTKASGSPPSSFAPKAKKIVIDIDIHELNKFDSIGLDVQMRIHSSAQDFFKLALDRCPALFLSAWNKKWKNVAAECREHENTNRSGPGINPYSFLAQLSQKCKGKTNVYVDTGCGLPYTISAFERGTNTRIFHDFNNTAMGWSVPASIGGHFSDPSALQIVIIGDGSLTMALSDLSTLASVNPRAKVVLLDNSGYGMIRQTQDQWLESEYVGSSFEGGLNFPDWQPIAEASGYRYSEVTDSEADSILLTGFFESEVPEFLCVKLDTSWRVIPQVKFGNPNWRMDPQLEESAVQRLLS